MMSIDQTILAKRLRDARENTQLTQEAVAEELGLPRTAVVQIEAGKRSVSTLELADLARLYHRRIVDFFQESATEEQDILLAIHRLSPEFKDHPQVEHEIARHVQICQEAVQLRLLLGLSATSGPPKYDLSTPRNAAEAVRHGSSVALEERRRLGLGDNPIPDMADLITSEGIWASGAKLPDEMSGMFLRHNSIGLVILVNYDHPRSRKRFSYAHEFAHALLDRDQSVSISQVANRQSPIEVRANAFAATFLMPAPGIAAFLAQRNKGLGSRENFPVYDVATDVKGLELEVEEALWRSSPGSQRITYQLVASLAHHYGVSYQAATYRLKGLGAVSDADAKSLLSQEQLGLSFLSAIRMKDDLEGKDKRHHKLDRELVGEVLGLAVEAFNREEISRAKFVELGMMLGIRKEAVLKLVEA